MVVGRISCRQRHQSSNRHVQGVGFVHLANPPERLSSVYAIVPSVAFITQGNACVLPVLFEVVGLAGAGLVADAAT